MIFNLPVVALLPLALVFFVVRSYLRKRQEDRALSKIPTHTFSDGRGNNRERYMTDLKELVESGYRLYNKNGKPFKVIVPIGGYSVRYRVILPKENLEEIKTRPNTQFSWALASGVIFAEKYTGAPPRGPWSGKALRVGIHQNLRDITDQLDRKIDRYLSEKLVQEPSSTQTINFMSFFIPQIATVTNTLLCGEKLGADPEWVAETADFATNRYKSADDVRAYPPIVASIASGFIPSVKKLRASRKYVKRMLTPMYEDLKQQTAGNKDAKSELRQSSYGFEWLWGGAPDDVTLDDFSDTMMRTLIAAIHTTAKTVTIALIDMLTTPGLADELREEIKSVRSPGGEVNIDDLLKMDCFLKESQRLTPVFILTMNRIALQDYVFSDSGLLIPKGTMTTAATAAIATDPEVFGRDSNEFDAKRFLRLRDEASGSSYKMGMATYDSMGFGLGAQACPGRFLAVNQVKLLLTKLLTGWDLQLIKDGQIYKGPRPKYQYFDFSVVAPNEFQLQLKKF